MVLVELRRFFKKVRCNGRMRRFREKLRVHRRKNTLIVNYGRFQMCIRSVLVRSNE